MCLRGVEMSTIVENSIRGVSEVPCLVDGEHHAVGRPSSRRWPSRGVFQNLHAGDVLRADGGQCVLRFLSGAAQRVLHVLRRGVENDAVHDVKRFAGAVEGACAADLDAHGTARSGVSGGHLHAGSMALKQFVERGDLRGFVLVDFDRGDGSRHVASCATFRNRRPRPLRSGLRRFRVRCRSGCVSRRRFPEVCNPDNLLGASSRPAGRNYDL